MKLIFLGTGTSQGVPMIGSTRAVSFSSDKRDKRLRTSAMVVTDEGKNILIDCGPDFRYQMLRAGVDDIDAILFTHAHADHTAGIDDIRPICYLKNKDIDIYARGEVLDALKGRFAYIFETGENRYPGAPSVRSHEIGDSEFAVAGERIIPIRASHGWSDVLGFRIGKAAYLTDVKTIYEDSYKLLEGIDTLVVNCLRLTDPHPTHMILPEALEVVKRINPRRTYFTHISETMGFHATAQSCMPSGVFLAYDTLEIDI